MLTDYDSLACFLNTEIGLITFWSREGKGRSVCNIFKSLLFFCKFSSLPSIFFLFSSLSLNVCINLKGVFLDCEFINSLTDFLKLFLLVHCLTCEFLLILLAFIKRFFHILKLIIVDSHSVSLTGQNSYSNTESSYMRSQVLIVSGNSNRFLNCLVFDSLGEYDECVIVFEQIFSLRAFK